MSFRNSYAIGLVVAMISLLLFFLSLFLPSSTAPIRYEERAPWKSLRSIPHDNSCFTQGLLFLDKNTAIESCGLYGKSRIQLLDFTAFNKGVSPGPVVSKSKSLDPSLFAEGIAIANGELFVLTWREHVLLVLDPLTLELKRTLAYPLEGWGLEYRPASNTFLATDGSSNVYHLSIDDKEVRIIKTVPSRCGQGLNELEYVGDKLFANAWLTNLVYSMDPDSGACAKRFNLQGLARGAGADVLNGIAASPDATGLWVTGKLWRYLHLIQIS